jgi:cell wall-associated NlpC family hydrolase
MGKIKSALLLGVTAVILGGCVFLPSSQPYWNQQYEPYDAPARRALLEQAHQALGVRYKYGGDTPGEGFDCSGLTQYVYKNGQGITLPRTAAEQSQASRTLSFEEMRPGDLIFFRTSGSTVNHVGIYIGRGDFIHAASGGSKVSVDNLSKTYWQQRLVKFGAFLA